MKVITKVVVVETIMIMNIIAKVMRDRLLLFCLMTLVMAGHENMAAESKPPKVIAAAIACEHKVAGASENTPTPT
ncbi:MAG: hypothetical protein GYA24_14470 [Candidatus Lokiarchaeota archaeon]|nr:hypothetical protein [Candidatus Lokiarchaeota archaeon]